MAKGNFTKNKAMNSQEAIELIRGSRRESDDFVNATAWCQRFGREFSDFNKLPDTQKLIDAIRRNLNLIKSQVLEVKRGKGGGAFVHPLLAIKLAEWLSPDFEFHVKTVFQQYLEGNADLGLDIMLRDHNTSRVDRAKHRLRVVDANKQTAVLAIRDRVRPDQVHNDRYKGLYLKTCSQLREDARQSGITTLRDDETPLDVLSTYDLAMNELANMMALKTDNPNSIFSCASDLRSVHERQTGKPLTPEWEDNRMRPSKARQILKNPQMELPL